MKTIFKLLCLALSSSLLSGCKVISNIINGGGKPSSSNNSSENGSGVFIRDSIVFGFAA